MSRDEASDLEARISSLVALSEVPSGTRMEIVLGRRPNRTVPRPLESLEFRARFDMRMEVARVDGGLAVTPVSIAVDETPLRIRGRVGQSLYQSARAAGAPPRAIQEYLRALGTQLSVAGDVRGDDSFDLIIEHRRAETGEVEIGQLLYAGLVQSNREVQLLKWSAGGPAQWFEASGVGRQTGEMMMPVNGRQTSPFGYRVHPILGYRRLHTGIDFGAPYGAPIRAAASGTIDFAGRNRGYGNFVRINHGSGMQTAYGHMSRIAVGHGARVAQGEVIGYVGSTGMSTGPHLHYELMRNGQRINPRSVTFIQQAQLSGEELRRFRSTLARLRDVRPGAAMARREERGERRERSAANVRRERTRG
ncbi:MAG: M23 family metallopeptidase [Sphingomonadaceae bacterium]|nr:M23 family metallopeptidase [Sphingomonadaceae bacterium]